MQIIINIFLFCAKIAEKAIYFRPFWSSLLPFKIYAFFMILSLKANAKQFNLWIKINKILYKLYNIIQKKRERNFYNNFMKIYELAPIDTQKAWKKEMNRKVEHE